jgi:ribosomal protein S18 acetylase RimI-like enzyme
VLTILAYGIERGCQFVTLEYRVSNHAAARLYDKAGFKAVGVRKGYYINNGEDAVVAEIADLSTPKRRRTLERLIGQWKQRHEYDINVDI